MEFPASKDCWQLIIPISRRQDYTTFQPWKLQSVLPHQQSSSSKLQNSFLFLFLLPVFLLFPVLDLLLLVPWGQCRDRTSPLLPGQLSVQLCKPSLTRTGALSRGHGMKRKSGFAASVTFTSHAVWQESSGFASHPCPLVQAG